MNSSTSVLYNKGNRMSRADPLEIVDQRTKEPLVRRMQV